jgi:phosphoribosylglycinamide formyltransferase-1
MEGGEDDREGSLLVENRYISRTRVISTAMRIDDDDDGRIAVMASGRGTDFQAILDARERGELRCEIAVLICNIPGARAIERAKKHGIPYTVIDHRNRGREEFDRMTDEELVKRDVDLVVLAGFMRILSPWFVRKWKDRIINIHPALLPSFPGANAHRDALEYGVKISGLTIHFVDEDVDHGPIIFQYPVEVRDGDTEETLSRRILVQEHVWYPRAIQWILDGKVRRIGRRVIIEREDSRHS